MNYGPSNIQEDSNIENKAGGIVSQEVSKSLYSDTGNHAGSVNMGAAAGGSALGNSIKASGNASGDNGPRGGKNALKRSSRASLKKKGSKGGSWTSQV